ncbi:transmembrane protein, putative (macronuclear) [Tetrahymena thermophila SB210]|uniref:Transmembrane protein, putative n=1 Tax=Tetrahymena thermophila (strain SB210) TaxID=312017 RepID=A4VE83_TETTS|nr:transmembrane protein, putative [Tetrahymena thermophila SB210]EDK31842.1 transmembrane protein, putative [Tetrahymena thermophila SB210]|eukprot:XP_001471275.1 transmembrane protein, putative [Tetrahymena thermophila SB210]
MVNINKVFIYIASLIISLISLIIMTSVKENLQSYQIKINKLAFFRLEKILINQIPSYQALVFVVYIPFCAYYIWNYIKDRKRNERIKNGNASFEEKYMLEVESNEAKQWSNILLTNLFIYMTQTLALLLAIFFSNYAINEIEYIQGQYESTQNSTDRDTIESVVDLTKSLKATIFLNSLCIFQIVYVSLEGCYIKIKSK